MQVSRNHGKNFTERHKKEMILVLQVKERIYPEKQLESELTLEQLRIK